MNEAAAAWLDLFGRLHPAVLHLPIGLLVGLAAIELATMVRRAATPREITRVLVSVTALAALLAAGTGYALGRENADSSLTFMRHQQLGIALAAACVLTAIIHLASSNVRAYRVCLVLTLALLVPVGHFGGTMTHGHGFLTVPLARVLRTTASALDPESSVPAETAIVRAGPAAQAATEQLEPEPQPPRPPPAIAHAEPVRLPDEFASQVLPIFAAACVDCHGGSRQKGGLALHTASAMAAGGKNGPVFIAGYPDKSELLRRLRLPAGDKQRMPPAGKPQLTDEQIRIVEAWIRTARVPEVLEAALASAQEQSLGDILPTSPDTDMEARSAPIRSSVAQRQPTGSPALEALTQHLVHFERAGRDPELLAVNFAAAAANTDDATARRLLEPMLPRLESVRLSQTRVGDATAALLSAAEQLQRLDLRSTALTDAGLAALRGLPRLEELVVARTRLTDAAVGHLAAMPALKRVYVWDSGIGPAGVADLRVRRPELHVDTGDFQEAAAHEVEPEIRLTSDAPPPGEHKPATGAAIADAAPAGFSAANTLCPVSGKAVDPRYTIVHRNRLIAFCCPNCPGQFWANPAHFEDKLPETSPVAASTGN